MQQLIIVDPISEFCSACEHHFETLPDVKIVNGYFEDLSAFDCMVSAANSFGIMDGGVDLAITRFFGDQLMRRVQRRIHDEFLGEQPVGTCIIVETGNANHPFLAHTPTMRIPMRIAKTDNVYQAMWAMLVAVHMHNKRSDRPINTVACPGLGTATGRVPFDQAARLMALAYRNSLEPPKKLNWPIAQLRQKEIGVGGDAGFEEAID